MNRGVTLHFQVIKRRHRAAELVPKIRRCSKRFKAAVLAQDHAEMAKHSRDAWDALTNLFETLRGEQDEGNLSTQQMKQPTGWMIDALSAQDQQRMILAAHIDHRYPGISEIGLRQVLNKIAHYDSSLVTYRIDGRGAHYLVLGGRLKNSRWVMEVLVSKLCRNAAAAIRTIP